MKTGEKRLLIAFGLVFVVPFLLIMLYGVWDTAHPRPPLPEWESQEMNEAAAASHRIEAQDEAVRRQGEAVRRLLHADACRDILARPVVSLSTNDFLFLRGCR